MSSNKNARVGLGRGETNLFTMILPEMATSDLKNLWAQYLCTPLNYEDKSGIKNVGSMYCNFKVFTCLIWLKILILSSLPDFHDD